MRRREFIAALLGGTATPFMRPPAASSQGQTLPVVAFLGGGSRETSAPLSAAFRRGLAEGRYVEPRNVVIEEQFAGGQLDRLPAMATEAVDRHVAVIVVIGFDAARAAKNATAAIPIVFLIGNDPVQTKLVASLNRPSGNMTGATIITREVQGKRLEMTRELLPDAAIIATLSNPVSVVSDINLRDLEAAAASVGQRLLVLRTSSNDEIKAAFVAMVQQGTKALFVNSNPFFSSRTELIVELAARHRVPAIFASREEVVVGGLMSYGTDSAETGRQIGLYTARVLSGENPANLPILRPTKFELVINLKTAKALGLTIPETLLATADEVIQ
jgi:putative tryptophan/tyrosine transport system substrate-binding protein